MLPKGGDGIWGPGADMCNASSAIHGLECKPQTGGNSDLNMASFVQFTDKSTPSCAKSATASIVEKFGCEKRHGVKDTIDLLLESGAGFGPEFANPKFVSYDKNELSSPRTWHDSSRTPLPNAPNMKIYCFYGTGIETERAFFYQHKDNINSNDETGECTQSPNLPFIMDYSVEKNDEQSIKYGVKMVDGDGSVPLVSLGYMCINGWKKKHLNPSRSKVVTREYPNQQAFSMGDPIRGGAKSSEHVDILGHLDLTEDFIRIVTDHESDRVDDQINSDIIDISKRIDEHPLGGLNPKRTNPQFRWLHTTNKT
jgi:phospholipid:diacylglycerol acyltransferase